MTPCPVASRMFQDWSEALREASSPEHRDSEELLTSYAGAVASALDRHLAACEFCKEPTMTQHTPGPWNLEPMRSPTGNMLITNGRRETVALLRDSLQDDARLIAAAPELLTS